MSDEGVRSSLEVERKYDVDAGAAVPAMTGFRAEAGEPVELRAVYYDTEQGDLAAQRITLRRREGGHDAGWHLKLPAERGRVEVTTGLADDLPAELADRIRDLLEGGEVRPIARLSTTRAPRILHDPRDRAVAELVDDHVAATDLRDGVERSWREWEVELLPDLARAPDADTVLDAIEAELLRAGAHPASSVSKLARALGRDRL